MKEQRISVRTDLLGVDANVSEDNGDSWTHITVKDISGAGIGFVADKEFAPGSKLLMEGTVTDHVREWSIDGEIRVVFSGKTPEGKFLYGSKFVKIEHVTELNIFIEQMITRHPHVLQG